MTPTPAEEVRRQYQRGIIPASVRRSDRRIKEVSSVNSNGSVAIGKTIRGCTVYEYWNAGEYEVVEWTSR